MRPETWNPPIELSKKEQKIVKLIKRAKLFVFLREMRHLLFDKSFQEELSKMYAEAEKGHPPVPPAQFLSWIGSQKQLLVLIKSAYLFVKEAKSSSLKLPVSIVLSEKSVPPVRKGAVFRFILMKSSSLNSVNVN